MIKNRQQTFALASDEFKDYWKKTDRRVHGGENAKNLRKTERPFNSTKPIHLILKSTRAVGKLSMWNRSNKLPIMALVYRHAELCAVKIYKYSNNGNHLHLAIKARDKKLFQKFLRVITGLIARHVLKAERGVRATEPRAEKRDSSEDKREASGEKGQRKFWDALAFTRIADWGKSFDKLSSYVWQNILEAAGVIAYQPRVARETGKGIRARESHRKR